MLIIYCSGSLESCWLAPFPGSRASGRERFKETGQRACPGRGRVRMPLF